MFRLVALICIVLIPGFESATEGIRPCPNGLPVPTSVDVENCVKAPCILPRGDNIHAQIHFENRKYFINCFLIKKKSNHL